MKSLPIQISADGCFCCFYNRFLMILAFERCVDVCMKNMKMLILQYFFNGFGWKSCRGKPSTKSPPKRPGSQEERASQREAFAVAFGKNTTTLNNPLEPERDTNPKAICQYNNEKHANVDFTMCFLWFLIENLII